MNEYYFYKCKNCQYMRYKEEFENDSCLECPKCNSFEVVQDKKENLYFDHPPSNDEILKVDFQGNLGLQDIVKEIKDILATKPDYEV